jgi:heme exporter protein A
MLQLVDVHFEYQDRPLLQGINILIKPGEMMHLQGPNGSGKTTLFKLIAGLLQLTQGQILYSGYSIVNDLSTYHRQICFVGHKTGINPYLTIKENCLFDLQSNTLTSSELTELVTVFKLESHLESPCGLLSAGQKRQVSLLRLWLSKAKLWLLDEPFIALDEEAMQLLMRHIESHRVRGGAVILTSHQSLPLGYSNYQEYCL